MIGFADTRFKTGTAIMPGFLKPTNKAVSSKKDNMPMNIKNEILERLGEPKNLLKVEVKEVGNKLYRANVVCCDYEPEHFIPSISRPYSWYIDARYKELIFKPEIVKVY